MFEYLKSIRQILPATLNNLTNNVHSIDVYYESFSYILHLLQLGYLTYNKPSKQFFLNENKNLEENNNE